LGGDIAAARSTYKDALELFQRMSHEKGIGVCFTNLGGAALMEQDFSQAISFYTRAVQNAEAMLQSHMHAASTGAAPHALGAAGGTTANPNAETPREVMCEVELQSHPQLPLEGARGDPSSVAPMHEIEEAGAAVVAGGSMGGLTPAPQGDSAHAELLLQLASRQSNLAKAYLTRSRLVTDTELLEEVGAAVPEKQAAANWALGSNCTRMHAEQDALCALDVLDAAARNFAAAHAALPPAKEATTHADAAAAFSEAALVCAHWGLVERSAALAQCASAAHNMFIALVTSPGFDCTGAVQERRVQLECRLIATQGAPLMAAKNHGEALKLFARSLTTGTVADPAWDRRVLWAMARLLQDLGETQGAVDTVASISGGRSGPCDFVLVLDKSGSMSGGLMNKAVDNMLKLYDTYMQPEDRLSFVVFNDTVRTVFQFRPKGVGAMAAATRRLMDQSRQASGLTACYDAVHTAMKKFVNDSQAGVSNGRLQIIVALTDGEDNSSSVTPYMLEQEFRTGAGKDTQLIMVGAGTLRNAGTLKSLCDASTKGAYVEAQEGAASLDDAFQAVAEAIVDVNLESL
jgi:Mg-chelatase subunit ChlD